MYDADSNYRPLPSCVLQKFQLRSYDTQASPTESEQLVRSLDHDDWSLLGWKERAVEKAKAEPPLAFDRGLHLWNPQCVKADFAPRPTEH